MKDVNTPTLHDWKSTTSFQEHVLELLKTVDSYTFFNSTNKRYQDLREAYVCAKFARVLGFTECKLIGDDFPDAACKNANETLLLEVAELVDKDRRRGDEFENKFIIKSQPESLLNATIAEWPNWLAGIIRKKASKYYTVSDVELVIYMNISLYDWPSEEPDYWRKMQSIPGLLNKTNKPPSFHRVWVLHGDRVVKVWPEFQKFGTYGNESITA